MSTVKVEPFFFGSEEDGIQINTEQLPGAIEKVQKEETKTEEAKTTEDKEETLEDSVLKQEEAELTEDDDIPDPLNLFNKPPKKVKEKDATEEKITSDKVDYKSLTDFLIETEVFKDFDGRDKFDYSSENFQALWKAQADNTVKELIAEERGQFGGAANQLIDYLKDGGTVEDFTANYSQQIEISSLDTSSSDGQEKAIKEYYKSLNWKDEKIKKHLERLKDSGEDDFKEEAEDCKTKLVEAIEEERVAMLKEQEAVAQDKKIRSENFNKAVREAIYKDTDLADREKKELDKFIYDYKFQDGQGNKYSEFMVEMNKINQDPKEYAAFLKYVKNRGNYQDKKIAEKEAVKKTFNFLKQGGNSLEGAQSKEIIKQKTTSPGAFKFK